MQVYSNMLLKFTRALEELVTEFKSDPTRYQTVLIISSSFNRLLINQIKLVIFMFFSLISPQIPLITSLKNYINFKSSQILLLKAAKCLNMPKLLTVKSPTAIYKGSVQEMTTGAFLKGYLQIWVFRKYKK